MNLNALLPHKRLIEKMPNAVLAVRGNKAYLLTSSKAMPLIPVGEPYIRFAIEHEDGVWLTSDLIKGFKLKGVEANIPIAGAWVYDIAIEPFVALSGEGELLATGLLQDLLNGETLTAVCGSDDLRPVYHYVRYDSEEIAATDAYRLARKPHGLWYESGNGFELHKSVFKPLTALGVSSDYVEIWKADKHLVIKVNGYEAVCKMLDGRFPDYKSVITKGSGDAAWLVNRKGLIHTLESVTKKPGNFAVFVCLDAEGKMLLNFCGLHDTSPEPLIKQIALKVFEKSGDTAYMDGEGVVSVDPALWASMLRLSGEELTAFEFYSPTRPTTVDRTGLLMPVYLGEKGDVPTKTEFLNGHCKIEFNSLNK